MEILSEESAFLKEYNLCLIINILVWFIEKKKIICSLSHWCHLR